MRVTAVGNENETRKREREKVGESLKRLGVVGLEEEEEQVIVVVGKGNGERQNP